MTTSTLLNSLMGSVGLIYFWVLVSASSQWWKDLKWNGFAVDLPQFAGVSSRKQQTPAPMHVLYGSQGNHSGFLGELETSLKSVILNAPTDTPLHIHMMVDTPAQNAIRDLIDQSMNLTSWHTRQPLSIQTYNVESYLPSWKQRILDTYQNFPPHLERIRHTMGSYFRLFSNQILLKQGEENDIQQVLYVDSDVVVMANLNPLWRHVQAEREHGYFFMWGEERCAGFNVIDISKLNTFWRKVQNYDLITLRPGSNFSHPTNRTKTYLNAAKILHQKGLGDQILVRSMQITEPELLGSLPEPWDVSANNGPWWKRNGTGLDTMDRPDGVGMLHFNGGGSSQDSVFGSHPFLQNRDFDDHPQDFQTSWGLAHYYNNLPWNWARYIAASQISEGDGYPVQVTHS